MRKIVVVYHTLDENGVGCWLLARDADHKTSTSADVSRERKGTEQLYHMVCSGRDGKGRRWQVNDDHECKIQKIFGHDISSGGKYLKKILVDRTRLGNYVRDLYIERE